MQSAEQLLAQLWEQKEVYLGKGKGFGGYEPLMAWQDAIARIRARDREIKKECADLAVKFLIENTRGNEMIYDDIHAFVLRDLG